MPTDNEYLRLIYLSQPISPKAFSLGPVPILVGNSVGLSQLGNRRSNVACLYTITGLSQPVVVALRGQVFTSQAEFNRERSQV